MDGSEDIHSHRGKWSQPGVPHKGWRYVSDYDSCEDGEDLHVTCEMCESQLIRYVHVMAHDDYPELLECGCVCAGRMEEDHVSAEARDKAMRLRATRKDRAKRSQEKKLRKQWVRSGTTWRIHSSVGKATVFRNGEHYNVLMMLRGEPKHFGVVNHPNPDAAKEAVERYLLKRMRE